jgi:hypothetical protein
VERGGRREGLHPSGTTRLAGLGCKAAECAKKTNVVLTWPMHNTQPDISNPKILGTSIYYILLPPIQTI